MAKSHDLPPLKYLPVKFFPLRRPFRKKSIQGKKIGEVKSPEKRRFKIE